jgi:hypothetical protein
MKPKSSSTSSSDWNRFAIVLLVTAVASLALTYVSVYLIDPYDMFLYSPNAERRPVANMPRHWKPGIARKAEFDSLILGTSSIMLLKPERLDQKLNTRIANLTLPAASPWEQLQILNLFQHYHDEIKLVMVSVDQAWCTIEGEGQYLDVGDDALVAQRHIQEWMYATDFVGQLPPLKSRIVKESLRQVRSLIGLEDYEKGNDGYFEFTREYEEKYTVKRIQQNLYGSPKRKPLKVREIKPAVIKNWTFPDIAELTGVMAALPATTRKILIFPPYHHFARVLSGSENKALWQECKKRTAKIGKTLPGVTVIDFLIDSEITLNDANYWDSIHYRVAIADQLEDIIATVAAGAYFGKERIAGQSGSGKPYRVLAHSRRATGQTLRESSPANRRPGTGQ